MKKLFIGLMGAAALTAASAANAQLTITGTQGTTAGSTLTVHTPDNTGIPNTVAFDTSTRNSGDVTSFFEFTEGYLSQGIFSVTTSAAGGTVTLEQVLTGGGITPLWTSTGTTNNLDLTTGNLTAGDTYRFSYTGNFGSGGGVLSGNASFYAVPEPATWAMMLIGFGAIGFSMRRRRSSAIAQLA